MYIYIYLFIYKKLSYKWKNFQEQKVFIFRFYILCENFSMLGPIIKKIPKFLDDPLKYFIRLFDTSSRILIYYWSKLSKFYTNLVFKGYSILYKKRD